MAVITAAVLLVAFALLVWAFAVFVWDLLEERMRGWLRVVLVVAALALVTAFEPDHVPASLSEPPARTEPAGLETTSEGTGPETTTNQTAPPSSTPSPSASSTPSPSASPSVSP